MSCRPGMFHRWRARQARFPSRWRQRRWCRKRCEAGRGRRSWRRFRRASGRLRHAFQRSRRASRWDRWAKWGARRAFQRSRRTAQRLRWTKWGRGKSPPTAPLEGPAVPLDEPAAPPEAAADPPDPPAASPERSGPPPDEMGAASGRPVYSGKRSGQLPLLPAPSVQCTASPNPHDTMGSHQKRGLRRSENKPPKACRPICDDPVNSPASRRAEGPPAPKAPEAIAQRIALGFPTPGASPERGETPSASARSAESFFTASCGRPGRAPSGLNPCGEPSPMALPWAISFGAVGAGTDCFPSTGGQEGRDSRTAPDRHLR